MDESSSLDIDEELGGYLTDTSFHDVNATDEVEDDKDYDLEDDQVQMDPLSQ